MVFETMRGIIALDIDGTITAEGHSIPLKVKEFLTHLQSEKWQLIFITGRPFQWAYRSLSELNIPYALAVQNGALILDIPSQKILDKRYLQVSILKTIEIVCKQFKTDFIIYSGWDNSDRCYYRPKYLPHSLMPYLRKRYQTLQEIWLPIEQFHELPISSFSSIKCFAKGRMAHELGSLIEQETNLHAPVNIDPFDQDYFVIQATHEEATKGKALKHFSQSIYHSGPIIAAGDDANDKSMLDLADIKIVMENGTNDLKKLAHIIAPPASKMGIIEGLNQAIEISNKGRF